jgi:hypothetical protein
VAAGRLVGRSGYRPAAILFHPYRKEAN